MSDSGSDEREIAIGPGDDWESMMKRISDTVKTDAGPGMDEARADLAGQLAEFEARAIDAEETLKRERREYAVRLKTMEERLIKLEPWLRRLREQYSSVVEERDELLKKALSAGGASDAEEWKKRILSLTAERDRAQGEIETQTRQLEKVRGIVEKTRTLARQVQQLETETAAHKAVARAAQDELKQMRQRMELAERRTAEAVTNAGLGRDAELEELRVALSTRDDDIAEAEAAVIRAMKDGVEARGRAELAEARISTLQSEAVTLRDAVARARDVANRAAGASTTGDFDEQLRRIRVGMCNVLGDAVQRLAAGVDEVIGPGVAMPTDEVRGEALPAAERDPDELTQSGPVAEWDDLLSDLETLRTDVEDLGVTQLDDSVDLSDDDSEELSVDDTPAGGD